MLGSAAGRSLSFLMLLSTDFKPFNKKEETFTKHINESQLETKYKVISRLLNIFRRIYILKKDFKKLYLT